MVSLQSNFRLILASVLVGLVHPASTAALVVEPLIAISVLKVTVYLVSMLLVPLTALTHLLTGKKLGKTILISLAILTVIFMCSYLALKGYSKPRSSQNMPSLEQVEDRVSTMPAPDSGSAGIAEPQLGRPFPAEYVPQDDIKPAPEYNFVAQRAPEFSFVRDFPKSLAVAFLILSLPVGSLVAIYQMTGKSWSRQKSLLIWFLITLNLSILLAYTLTVFRLLIAQ